MLGNSGIRAMNHSQLLDFFHVAKKRVSLPTGLRTWEMLAENKQGGKDARTQLSWNYHSSMI